MGMKRMSNEELAEKMLWLQTNAEELNVAELVEQLSAIVWELGLRELDRGDKNANLIQAGAPEGIPSS